MMNSGSKVLQDDGARRAAISLPDALTGADPRLPATLAPPVRRVRAVLAAAARAQRAHLEGMGDLDEVAREKGSIFAGLPADGIAVINADDGYAALWREMAGGRRVRSFAIDHPADVHGNVYQHGLEISLALTAAEGAIQFTLAIPGRHNARNAVAAAAACLAAGVPLAA